MRTATEVRCWARGCGDDAIPLVRLCIFHVVVLHDAGLRASAIDMRRPAPPRRQPPAPRTPPRPSSVAVEEVVAIVAEYFAMRPHDVVSRRDPDHIYARHVAAYLAHERGASLPTIAEVLDQHHTTVLAAWRKVRRLRTLDWSPVGGDVDALERLLEPAPV